MSAETPQARAEDENAAEPSLAQLDVLAQERMAYWAAIVGLFTSVGVGLVYLTWRAASDANRGFALASQQQLTAYVVAEAFELNLVHHDLDGAVIYWSFVLRNAGQTPAFDVSHDWKCDWATPHEMEHWDLKHADVGGAIMAPGRGQEISGRLDGKWSDVEIVMHLAGEAPETIWIKGVATYRDLNKRTWRHEYCWCVGDPRTELLPHGVRRAEQGRVTLTPNVTGNSLRIIEEPDQKQAKA